MTESSLSRAKCPSCSEPVSGNFCSVCGTSLLDGGKSSIEELPIIGELVTFVRTYWKILRSPIAEPVRLTESPGYQDHFKFLMLGVGIYVAYLVFMATMAREGTGVSGFTPDQQSFIDNYKYLVVINYGVAALLAYGLFRILAAKTLNFKTHVKLWAILTGFYMPLQMLLLIVYAIVYAGGGAVMAENAAQFRSGLSAAGPWIGQAFNLVCSFTLLSCTPGFGSSRCGSRWRFSSPCIFSPPCRQTYSNMPLALCWDISTGCFRPRALPVQTPRSRSNFSYARWVSVT